MQDSLRNTIDAYADIIEGMEDLEIAHKNVVSRLKAKLRLFDGSMLWVREVWVKGAFESNYIAPLGPQVDAFEREFAEYFGIKHCLALSSGTAATHLALKNIGVGLGDVIFASTLTFIGSVSPIIFEGAIPVFIDSDRES